MVGVANLGDSGGATQHSAIMQPVGVDRMSIFRFYKCVEIDSQTDIHNLINLPELLWLSLCACNNYIYKIKMAHTQCIYDLVVKDEVWNIYFPVAFGFSWGMFGGECNFCSPVALDLTLVGCAWDCWGCIERGSHQVWVFPIGAFWWTVFAFAYFTAWSSTQEDVILDLTFYLW